MIGKFAARPLCTLTVLASIVLALSSRGAAAQEQQVVLSQIGIVEVLFVLRIGEFFF